MLTRIERLGFAGGIKLIFSNYDRTSTNTCTENFIYLNHEEVSKLYKYIKISTFEFVVLKKLWKYSIPLVPNSISWWIFNASDRIIISAILGVGQNGILSAAHKFSTVYITFYNIFNMSWIETISIHINDSDIKEFFNKLFNTVLKIFTTIAIGIIAFMPFVYGIMINERYYEGFYQVPIMMIGAIFSIIVSTLGRIICCQKKYKSCSKYFFNFSYN